MRHPNRTVRLLPWTSHEGKPCYLLTGEGDSVLSRFADDIERAQLRMGTELLGHAHALLGDPGPPPESSASSPPASLRL